MTLRDNLTNVQRQAHAILDMVRQGVSVPESRIRWALVILGDVA